jgi:hypothetical protein
MRSFLARKGSDVWSGGTPNAANGVILTHYHGKANVVFLTFVTMGFALPWKAFFIIKLSSPIPPIFFHQRKKMGEKNAGRGKPLHPAAKVSLLGLRPRAACWPNKVKFGTIIFGKKKNVVITFYAIPLITLLFRAEYIIVPNVSLPCEQLREAASPWARLPSFASW